MESGSTEQGRGRQSFCPPIYLMNFAKPVVRARAVASAQVPSPSRPRGSLISCGGRRRGSSRSMPPPVDRPRRLPLLTVYTIHSSRVCKFRYTEPPEQHFSKIAEGHRTFFYKPRSKINYLALLGGGS